MNCFFILFSLIALIGLSRAVTCDDLDAPLHLVSDAAYKLDFVSSGMYSLDEGTGGELSLPFPTTVSISGPANHWSFAIPAGNPLTVTLPADLSDAVYRYEVKIDFSPTEQGRSVEDVPFLPETARSFRGTFQLENGNLICLSETQLRSLRTIEEMVEEREESQVEERDLSKRDIVHLDDVVIQFSTCVGNDCVNGENFGFDTLRLKENNLRIHFQDTSNSASFPSNDWRIVANDTSNGGANYLAFEDSNSGRIPFRVEAGARANALVVEADGNIGIGRLDPVVELHVADGDSPTLRLEQDGTSGFTPQTWDIAGNETNFFVRDVTNGSKLPFKVLPNSPHNNLVLKSGKVGINTNVPSSTLHVYDTNSGGIKVATPTSTLNVESTTGTTEVTYQNTDGANRVIVVNYIAGADVWDVRYNPVAGRIRYRLNLTDIIQIEDDGTITNMVAKREVKKGLRSDENILGKVESLDIHLLENEHSGNLHMEPDANDFHEIFGLGRDTSLDATNVAGVALAAIKELNEKVIGLEKTVTLLQNKVDECNC